MPKPVLRLASLCFVALFLTGCSVFPYPFVKVAPTVMPPRGGLPYGPPPTPVLPIMRLEYAGSAMTGVQQNFSWVTGNSSVAGSGRGSWPPYLPDTLTVPARAGVDIVVGYSTPPAALWVVELDSTGVPQASTALTPTSTAVSYTVTTSGGVFLQVMAQWTYQNYVTYMFSLDVKP
jgi:hypothetical protein